MRSFARLAAVGRRGKRMKRNHEVDGPVCEAARNAPCMLSFRIPDPKNHPHHTGETRRDYSATGDCLVMPLAPEIHRDYHDMTMKQWAKKYGRAKPFRWEMREMAKRFGEQFKAQEAA